MANTLFDWARAPQSTVFQLLLATFAPSGVAFFGFHWMVPRLVSRGVPGLIAWPSVASLMLAGLVLLALVLLRPDARRIGFSPRARLCLGWPSGRQ